MDTESFFLALPFSTFFYFAIFSNTQHHHLFCCYRWPATVQCCLCRSALFNLSRTLWTRSPHYPHFIHEKNEAQRTELLAQGHIAGKQQSRLQADLLIANPCYWSLCQSSWWPHPLCLSKYAFVSLKRESYSQTLRSPLDTQKPCVHGITSSFLNRHSGQRHGPLGSNSGFATSSLCEWEFSAYQLPHV